MKKQKPKTFGITTTTAFVTTDGVIHGNKQLAVEHQRKIDEAQLESDIYSKVFEYFNTGFNYHTPAEWNKKSDAFRVEDDIQNAIRNHTDLILEAAKGVKAIKDATLAEHKAKINKRN